MSGRSSETSPHPERFYTHSHHAFPRRERLRAVPHEDGLYDVAPDVLGVKVGIVNLYLVGHPRSADWVLVDAGVPGQADYIRELAAERFGRGNPPKAILLTHGHFDHVGSLEALLEHWPVPVYAHHTELPFLTGRASYPPPDPTVGGGAMSWFSFLYPTKPIDLGARVQALPESGEIPGLPDWRAIPTPGHSPGHVSYFREADRLLLAGDAFVTVRAEGLVANLALKPVVQRPPAYFTPDWPAVKISLQKLAELQPNVVATGHGYPLYGEKMRHALMRLAYEFERHPLGLPAKGRYREIPALFDETTGLTRLPPAPAAPYAVAVCILMLIGFLIGLSVDEPRRPRGRR